MGPRYFLQRRLHFSPRAATSASAFGVSFASFFAAGSSSSAAKLDLLLIEEGRGVDGPVELPTSGAVSLGTSLRREDEFIFEDERVVGGIVTTFFNAEGSD